MPRDGLRPVGPAEAAETAAPETKAVPRWRRRQAPSSARLPAQQWMGGDLRRRRRRPTAAAVAAGAAEAPEPSDPEPGSPRPQGLRAPGPLRASESMSGVADSTPTPEAGGTRKAAPGSQIRLADLTPTPEAADRRRESESKQAAPSGPPLPSGPSGARSEPARGPFGTPPRRRNPGRSQRRNPCVFAGGLKSGADGRRPCGVACQAWGAVPDSVVRGWRAIGALQRRSEEGANRGYGRVGAEGTSRQLMPSGRTAAAAVRRRRQRRRPEQEPALRRPAEGRSSYSGRGTDL